MKKISLITGLASVFMCLLFMGLRDIGRYPEKIWLHRCNSLEKLYEKQSRYPNVEVDLVFWKDRVFDVTHDVDTSFNLSLGSYFSYMKDHYPISHICQILRPQRSPFQALPPLSVTAEQVSCPACQARPRTPTP